MAWDLSRRMFIKGGSLVALGLGGPASAVITRTAQAAGPTGSRKKVLVHVFLRGGVDGLSVMVPHGDSRYYDIRKDIAIPPPGKPGGVLRLDDHFGLHPALEPLRSLYTEKKMAAVHGVGNYGLTRSHFSAQDFVELGTPGDRSTTTGTLARLSGEVEGSGVLKSVAFSVQRPLCLEGPAPALVTPGILSFNLGIKEWREEAERRVRAMYEPSVLAPVADEVFVAMGALRDSSAIHAQPRAGVKYPDAPPGPSLRQAARLIEADLGTRCIFVPVGGRYDTHAKQLEAHAEEFPILSQALAAFAQDLGPRLDDVLVLVTTEFGRTAFVNGSHGTDHGSAFCALVIGGGVKGGRILGQSPDLAKSALYEERDVAVTTDFRDLYSEIAQGHLGVSPASKLFPGFSPGAHIGLFS